MDARKRVVAPLVKMRVLVLRVVGGGRARALAGSEVDKITKKVGFSRSLEWKWELVVCLSSWIRS